MRRMFLLIATALTFVNLTSVMAAKTTTITNTNNTGDIEIIYTVEQSYLISIPETFNLKKNEEVVKTVYAEDVCIDYGTVLKVLISGANYDDAWYIVDEGNEENRFEYTVGTESEFDDVENDEAILVVHAGNTGKHSQNLFFNLVDDVNKSGTYSDTLTFTVEISDVENARQ